MKRARAVLERTQTLNQLAGLVLAGLRKKKDSIQKILGGGGGGKKEKEFEEYKLGSPRQHQAVFQTGVR